MSLSTIVNIKEGGGARLVLRMFLNFVNNRKEMDTWRNNCYPHWGQVTTMVVKAVTDKDLRKYQLSIVMRQIKRN